MACSLLYKLQAVYGIFCSLKEKGQAMEKELKQLKADISLMSDWHDKWGEGLNWHFSICDALQLRGDDIPESWQYKPGLFGVDDDDINLDILKDYKTETLIRMGYILQRYVRLCEKAGLSY